MKFPPLWTEKQLTEEAATAVELFRKERMEEPLEAYLEFFDEYQSLFEELLEKTVDLTQLEANATEILTNPKLLSLVRYLSGPPISEDDLKTIANAYLSKKKLDENPEMLKSLVDVLLIGLDSRRFPWVKEDREPTEIEKHAAVIASAALMATSKHGTKRRIEGSAAQEEIVRAALKAIGMAQVPSRKMPTLALAPKTGEFCGKAILVGREADLTIGLYDERKMPVECKVSNSEVNSVKRLNNDAAAKAVHWNKDLGKRNVVPVAVLSGVYKVSKMLEAQEAGLYLIWAHDLQPLIDFISSTKPDEQPPKSRPKKPRK